VPHPRPSGAATGEHAAEQVLEPSGPATARAGGEPWPASGHGAQGVVLLALLLIGEHRVGLSDLLELLLRSLIPGVLVGMPLAGKFAVGLLHLRRVGVLGHPERGIEVL